MKKEIELDFVESFESDFNKEKFNRVLQNACTDTSVNKVVFKKSSRIEMDQKFSIEIKTLPAPNQKASGRCWIFAATNFLREEIAKKCNLANFEISQNYLAFYDKLEKINYYLEAFLKNLDKDPDSRLMTHLKNNPVGDGGQWEMFKSLVKKYGIVPKNVMNETFASSNTRETNFLINTSIRSFYAQAKVMYDADRINEIRPLKEETLKKLYSLLLTTYGSPVKEFDFEYVDKDGKYHIDRKLTPQEFYNKYVGLNLDDYVSVINAPCEDRPFYHTYTVDYVNNVLGGEEIRYLNLPLEEMKALVLKQLKDGQIVWFGSDSGKFGEREQGVWDPNQYDYKDAFDLDVILDKGIALKFGQSCMTHAMCITGANEIEGDINKFKIENSWGQEIAQSGYFVCSKDWFDKYVYQIAINKKYLTEDQINALASEPIHLDPWDPLGTLAD